MAPWGLHAVQRGVQKVTLNVMQFFKRTLAYFTVTVACLLIVSCGGGGDGGSAWESRPTGTAPTDSLPPKIQAYILSFDEGSYQGNMPNVSVSVQNSSTGADITTAIVTVNDTSFAYNSAPGRNAYEGALYIAPGDPIALRITVANTTYSVSSTLFTTYPAPSVPASGTWYAALPNAVTWSNGTPATDAVYNLAILDAQNPYGNDVWPANPKGDFQVLPTSSASYNIPENTISTGDRLLFTAIAKGATIPGAASGSGLIVAGCSTKQIKINGATISAITVTPNSPTMAWGSKQQFTATATFSDNSTLDVTRKVYWGTSGFALILDSSTPGLANTTGYGLSKVTAHLAYLPTVSGSASVTVLPPKLQSIQITPINRNIVPNTVQHFTAIGMYEDGNTQDITSSVDWISSNVAIVGIGNVSGINGQATPNSVGITTITASLQGISQSTLLTVVNRPTLSGNSIYLQSDTGDYIGGGISSSFTQADSQFFISADSGHLAVTVTGNQVRSDGNFMLPNTLSTFQPGYYGNVTRYPYNNPAVGGLDWSKDSRGCNMLSGWFTVDNVTYSSGRLSAIELHFVQHCENQSPALYGWLHLEP